jgi:predicted nuclease of predicted toxin-antitoxin system
VRLLLDAHASGPNVGRGLEHKRHDVRALDQEPALEGLDDDEVLALAATERRILVTHNVADFPRILREWAAAQRTHAGVILVYGIDHSEFALITRGIERWLQLRPDQEDWTDFPAIIDRRFARR